MAPQIDFGMNVNTRCPVIYPEHYPAPRMVDLGEELERLGYDTVFVGEQEEYRGLYAQIQRYAREAGRDPDAIVPSCQVLMNVNRDRALARREALDFINRYYVTTYTSVEDSMWERDPFGTPDECTTPRWRA